MSEEQRESNKFSIISCSSAVLGLWRLKTCIERKPDEFKNTLKIPAHVKSKTGKEKARPNSAYLTHFPSCGTELLPVSVGPAQSQTGLFAVALTKGHGRVAFKADVWMEFPSAGISSTNREASVHWSSIHVHLEVVHGRDKSTTSLSLGLNKKGLVWFGTSTTGFGAFAEAPKAGHICDCIGHYLMAPGQGAPSPDSPGKVGVPGLQF